MSAIDDIKSRLDIVDVVSQYVTLTRAGRTFKGLSPFQSERTPSFIVFPETQTYKDFSSGEQGDVFKFMMKKEGWTFAEALRELAHRAGVQLDERTEDQKKVIDYEQRLRDANTQAADYFHRLFVSAPQAEPCRKYIKDKRSLSENTIAEWQLGYSLMDYQSLMTYMDAKGFSAQELIDAGLVIQNDEGRRYDRFRGRLMIPIKDEKGRVVGFGSRSLDGSEPKYMNSPQTQVFDKGRLLFGLDRARGTVRNQQESVIVEGYMDVIGTHQAGFTNVVAGMGTSLTEDQFKMLKKLADKIVLALDADAAGNRAVLRGVDVARDVLDTETQFALDGRGVIRNESKLKADIRVALLPDGLDPDEVVLANPNLWRECIANAKPVVEHVINIALEKYNAAITGNDPRAKSDAVKAVAPILQDLSDLVQRDFYVQQLARRLQLNPRAVAQAISQTTQQKPKSAPNQATTTNADFPGLPSAQLSSNIQPAHPKRLNLEIHLISLLAQKPELLMDANVALTRANLEVIGERDFMNPALQLGFVQLSRAAMGQPLPEADDDWLTLLGDYESLVIRDELILREEAVRTMLRLREENLGRDHAALCSLIEDLKQNTSSSPIPPEADSANDLTQPQPAALPNVQQQLNLYNLQLQRIGTQRFRAQKALKLRSALNVN